MQLRVHFFPSKPDQAGKSFTKSDLNPTGVLLLRSEPNLMQLKKACAGVSAFRLGISALRHRQALSVYLLVCVLITWSSALDSDWNV